MRFHFLPGPKGAHFNCGHAQAGDLVNFFDRTSLQVKQIDHQALRRFEHFKQMFDQLPGCELPVGREFLGGGGEIFNHGLLLFA